MKHLALFIIIASIAMCACTNKQADSDTENSALNASRDSLITALAEKDSLMSLFSEVTDGLNQIKQMENLLNSTNLTSETPNKKSQIISDMALIQQALNDRRARIEELESRISKSNRYTEEMKKSIESLKHQLLIQEETINSLKEQLAAANIRIEELSTNVENLIAENEQVSAEKKAAQEENTRITNELNTCYYVVGSKKELKEHKIIEGGFLKKTKVMESDYSLSYFTQADKRTLTEIPLHSNKAKLLSKHPSGSYEITDNGSSKVLVILNATKFWELTNFLIIQVG